MGTPTTSHPARSGTSRPCTAGRNSRRFVAAVLGTIVVLGLAGACSSLETRFAGPGGARRLYEARCGFCHVPYLPRDFGPDEWPRLVDAMAGRAGLTRKARTRVLSYLQQESGAPL